MQLFPLKIFPSNTNFDFMRVKNLNYALSVFLFILSLVWIGIYKFNFGIDFAGGISMELRINQTPDLAKKPFITYELNIGEIGLQNFIRQVQLGSAVTLRPVSLVPGFQGFCSATA